MGVRGDAENVLDNMYKGTKFEITKLISCSGNANTSYNITDTTDSFLKYAFLIIRCKFTTSYSDYVYQLIPMESFETGTTTSLQSFGSISGGNGYLVLTIQSSSIYINAISWVNNIIIWGLK